MSAIDALEKLLDGKWEETGVFSLKQGLENRHNDLARAEENVLYFQKLIDNLEKEIEDVEAAILILRNNHD